MNFYVTYRVPGSREEDTMAGRDTEDNEGKKNDQKTEVKPLQHRLSSFWTENTFPSLESLGIAPSRSSEKIASIENRFQRGIIVDRV